MGLCGIFKIQTYSSWKVRFGSQLLDEREISGLHFLATKEV
jgi:hypothetical protein